MHHQTALDKILFEIAADAISLSQSNAVGARH
jgi:hypothetical protein